MSAVVEPPPLRLCVQRDVGGGSRGGVLPCRGRASRSGNVSSRRCTAVREKKQLWVPHPAKEIKSVRISAALFVGLTPETPITGGASLPNERRETSERVNDSEAGCGALAASSRRSPPVPCCCRQTFWYRRRGLPRPSWEAGVSKRQARWLRLCGPPDSLCSNQSHHLHMSPITGGLPSTGTQLPATGTNELSVYVPPFTWPTQKQKNKLTCAVCARCRGEGRRPV